MCKNGQSAFLVLPIALAIVHNLETIQRVKYIKPLAGGIILQEPMKIHFLKCEASDWFLQIYAG